MAVSMKCYACFVVLLASLAQVDDVLASTPLVPATPFTEDGDEYLPAQRRRHEEQSAPREQPQLGSTRPVTAVPRTFAIGAPSDLSLTVPFAPTPLYVFMSLQI